MSERFEASIRDWYSKSQTKSLEYLDLAHSSTPTNSELANNIGVLYERSSVFAKVALKHFYTIEENQRLLHKEIAQLKTSLQRLEEDQIRHRPLTKTDIQIVVQQAVEQPKAEILKLSNDLKLSVSKIGKIVEKIKSFIGE